MKKIAEEWIKKAEGDFKVALRESSAQDPVHDVICFHCHQCIEKYLKAALIEHDLPFGKVHDLEVLLHSASRFLPQLGKKREDCIWLTQFSVRVRYPGFEATSRDAKKALVVTKKLRVMIRESLALENF